MRRHGPAIAALLALGLAAACSRTDQSQTSSDFKDAGHSAKAALDKLAHDPDLKRAEADLRHIGHDAGQNLRKTAAEAKAATHSLAADTGNAAHKAADSSDRRDSSNS